VLKARLRGDGTAWLPIVVNGARRITIEALVDTGIDGYLALPRTLKKDAALRPIGHYRFELADGRIVRSRVYLGLITFGGRTMKVPVVLTRSRDPILGIALFRNQRLTIRCRRRTVELRPDR
jgi:clan AA aspartic protease